MFEDQLNEEQLLAVNHIDGPCLVSACPGAGKTRVIAFRAINMLLRGIHPSKILLVTFTNKAAREMRERIDKLAGQYGVNSEPICISTFHSYCLMELRHSGTYSNRKYGNINILDEDDIVSLLKNICEDLDISAEKSDLQKFKYTIDNLREKCLSMDEIKAECEKDFLNSKLIDKYFEALTSINGIDFSGIMYEFYMRLISDNSFKEKICSKFKFIMIDEVQDTNIIQFKISQIISSGHKNVFMVGDTDQSIYQWRGANPSQVGEFVRNNNCKIYKLTKNYRCTANITNLASNIISKNSNRLNERIMPHKADGEPVRYDLYMTRDLEADAVVRQIMRLKMKGVKYKDIAILLRANHLTRSIEQNCMLKNIPYTITGGFRFFDREEIKDVISMLKFINNRNDVLSLARIMNKPKRGLGGKCVQVIGNIGRSGLNSDKIVSAIYASSEIKEAQKNALINLITKILDVDVKNTSVGNLIKHVVAASDYKTYLNTFKNDTFDNKMDNVDELIKSAEASNQNINDFLSSIALMSTPKEADEEDKMNSVKIMTMHAAKGLEFQNVFMPCCEEQILPHKRSIMDGGSAIEEERRLCYVAMTRGMERLFVSSSVFDSQYDRSMKMPSRFLIEGGLTDKERYAELIQELKDTYVG